MKSLIVALTLGLISTNAFATLAVYDCKLDSNPKLGATLVVETSSWAVDWMPARNLKTTKANAMGQVLNGGDVQVQLFGFQDQADWLDLPAVTKDLPSTLNVQTYHDNDDQAEDIQKFTCTK